MVGVGGQYWPRWYVNLRGDGALVTEHKQPTIFIARVSKTQIQLQNSMSGFVVLSCVIAIIHVVFFSYTRNHNRKFSRFIFLLFLRSSMVYVGSATKGRCKYLLFISPCFHVLQKRSRE